MNLPNDVCILHGTVWNRCLEALDIYTNEHNALSIHLAWIPWNPHLLSRGYEINLPRLC